VQRQRQIADEQRAAAERVEAEKYAQMQAAIKAQKQIDDYRMRIQIAIRDKVMLPPGIDSKLEAVFEVGLVRSGTVYRMKLIKPSGAPAYDRAVERAIELAQPLPVPEDMELFQQVRDLTLVFRPNE
jgi:colicin import membrane protein